MNIKDYDVVYEYDYFPKTSFNIGSGVANVNQAPVLAPGYYTYPCIVRKGDEVVEVILDGECQGLAPGYVVAYRFRPDDGGYVAKINQSLDGRSGVTLSPVSMFDYRTMMFVIMGEL